MSLPLFDVELDINFWPEALNASFFIPGPNFEPDTPRYFLSIIELVHSRSKGDVADWVPFLDPAVYIRDCVESHTLLEGGGTRVEQGEICFKVRSRCARNSVEDVAGDWGRHCEQD